MFSDLQLTRRDFCAVALTAPALALYNEGSRGEDAQPQTVPAPEALRVAVLTDQPLLVQKAPDGRLTGIAVDVTNALAAKLEMSPQTVPYPTLVRFHASVGKDEWDLAIMGRDLSRADQLTFSEPVLSISYGCVVRPGLSLLSTDELDRSPLRIAVAEHGPADAYLSRNLKKAKLVRLPGGTFEAKNALSFGQADAYAGTEQAVHELASAVLGARVLVGRLTSVHLVFAAPKSKASLIAQVNSFLTEAKKNATLTTMIKQSNLFGVEAR